MVGISKSNIPDYYGAISDYSLAIEMNPTDPFVFLNRGSSKSLLKDYKGAIIDFNKAIELNPNYALAYYFRGTCKLIADLAYCSDFKIACELGDSQACEIFNSNCK